MGGCASVKLNDHMAVGASQALAWLAVPHLGAHPMMRFILDESHQKEVIMYHFLSAFSNLFSYSCSRSDCTGFHKLKPRVGELESIEIYSLSRLLLNLMKLQYVRSEIKQHQDYSVSLSPLSLNNLTLNVTMSEVRSIWCRKA